MNTEFLFLFRPWNFLVVKKTCHIYLESAQGDLQNSIHSNNFCKNKFFFVNSLHFVNLELCMFIETAFIGQFSLNWMLWSERFLGQVYRDFNVVRATLVEISGKEVRNRLFLSSELELQVQELTRGLFDLGLIRSGIKWITNRLEIRIGVDCVCCCFFLFCFCWSW